MFPIIVPVIYKGTATLGRGAGYNLKTGEPDPKDPQSENPDAGPAPIEVYDVTPLAGTSSSVQTDISDLLSTESRIPIIPYNSSFEDGGSDFRGRFSEIRRLSDGEVIGFMEVKTEVVAGSVNCILNIYNGEGNLIGRANGGFLFDSSEQGSEILSSDGQSLGFIQGERILDARGVEFGSFSHQAFHFSAWSGVWGRIQDGRIVAVAGDPLEDFWETLGIEKPPPLPLSSGDLPEERIMIHQGEYGFAVRGENNILATSQVGNCVCVSFFDPVSGIGSLAHFDDFHGSQTEIIQSLDNLLDYFTQRGVPISRLRVQIAGGMKYKLESRQLAARLIRELNTRGISIAGAELFPETSINVWLDLSDGNLRIAPHYGSMPQYNEIEWNYFNQYDDILFAPGEQALHLHQISSGEQM